MNGNLLLLGLGPARKMGVWKGCVEVGSHDLEEKSEGSRQVWYGGPCFRARCELRKGYEKFEGFG